MSVGILLVSHKGIASVMLATATRIWNRSPANTDFIEVEFDADVQQTAGIVQEKIMQMDNGEGILVLTDLIGATPCNLVSNLNTPNVAVVSGLNLPMLIRSYNYADRSLNELADLAIEGGQRGISRLNQASCKNATGI